eukprot:CAMPEP_0116985568 /NCGR_PEP_ID=MMETSP0467-20121206/62331_1 /TAXON_ID=283647 /ORGANISM="Mesodinium pulex, Strain SPMC105" /LENGTH=321 /DNA_ID=CAMNT_0004680907 /DNA_START=391 /DNA_END=1356 /DNA_ORIENTATION=-
MVEMGCTRKVARVVLVTGDGDFIPAIDILKAYQITVHVVGFNISNVLKQACSCKEFSEADFDLMLADCKQRLSKPKNKQARNHNFNDELGDNKKYTKFGGNRDGDNSKSDAHQDKQDKQNSRLLSNMENSNNFNHNYNLTEKQTKSRKDSKDHQNHNIVHNNNNSNSNIVKKKDKKLKNKNVKKIGIPQSKQIKHLPLEIKVSKDLDGYQSDKSSSMSDGGFAKDKHIDLLQIYNDFDKDQNPPNMRAHGGLHSEDSQSSTSQSNTLAFDLELLKKYVASPNSKDSLGLEFAVADSRTKSKEGDSDSGSYNGNILASENDN